MPPVPAAITCERLIALRTRFLASFFTSVLPTAMLTRPALRAHEVISADTVDVSAAESITFPKLETTASLIDASTSPLRMFSAVVIPAAAASPKAEIAAAAADE